jgi:xylulokinase
VSYLVGADIGTSGLKAVLVDSAGAILAVAERHYQLYHPRPAWAENHPEDWFDALVLAIGDLIAGAGVKAADVVGLGIAGQRDTAVLLDQSGTVVTPSIHWSDQRDPVGTAELFATIGHERIVRISGVAPTPGLVLPNLAWTRRSLPSAWSRTRYVVQPKDYVAFRLTGEVATDTSTPSRSLLNDWRRDEWSADLCAAADIPEQLLASIRYQPWEARGVLSTGAASELGLPAGTTLAAGGGDDQAAMLGSGVVRPGAVSIGTGSSMCWRIVTADPMPDQSERISIARHVVPSLHIYEMVAVGTGASLRWFRDSLGASGRSKRPSYEALLAEATTVPAGADGLLFYPFLSGATFPRRSEYGSGVFFGIRAGHDRRHFVRAILEGTAYLYPSLAEASSSHGAAVDELTMVDGEARSPLWNQIKADVLNRPISTPRVVEAAALGSAIHAGVAANVYTTVYEGARSLVEPGQTYEPDAASAARYAELRGRWESVGAFLFEAFAAIGGWSP